MSSERVGIFGGAFNPPHLGHVALARRAVEVFALARLLVRVVEDPGHKHVETPADVRVGLARIAFAGVEEAVVGLDRFARTVDSLAELGLDDPLFLVGADEFASFLAWKEPARILELASLGVATRPGYPQEVLDAVLGELDAPERVVFFEIEPLPISSSEIRRRVGAGEPISGLVDAEVEQEIHARGLYREPLRLH
ncbi:MAG: nicotinate-nicotinamide nucleotide adenylyltransferase [Gaiella sp.]